MGVEETCQRDIRDRSKQEGGRQKAGGRQGWEERGDRKAGEGTFMFVMDDVTKTPSPRKAMPGFAHFYIHRTHPA